MAEVNANQSSSSEINFQVENNLIYGMRYAQIEI